jgi:hypothetical protein
VGEISDMMLDGTLCCECGGVRGPTDPEDPNFKRWQPEGVPRLCKDCRKDQYKRMAMNSRRQRTSNQAKGRPI